METLVTIHLQEGINEERLIEKVEEEYKVLGIAGITTSKGTDSYSNNTRKEIWIKHIKKLLDMCV